MGPEWTTLRLGAETEQLGGLGRGVHGPVEQLSLVESAASHGIGWIVLSGLALNRARQEFFEADAEIRPELHAWLDQALELFAAGPEEPQ